MLYALDVLDLWAMVSTRRLLQLFSLPLLLITLTPSLFVLLQGILYQPFLLWSNRLLQKIIHFQSKTNFFFQLITSQFWFFCFVYMYFLGHFLPSLNYKIALCLHGYIASYLISNQIMWHNKRIHGHVLKVTNSCYFFVFWRN